MSLAYGGVIAFISLAIVATLNSVERLPLLLPMLAGFALVCPWLAVGLYAISRAISSGQTISVGMVASAVGRNGDQIGLMGIFLMLIHIVWVRIATLLFVLFFARVPIGFAGLVDLLLRTQEGFIFLLLGTAIGGVLATITFIVSVISIPMLIDSDVGVFSAIATSCSAVSANRVPMALWASIIAGTTFLSFATGFVALIVVMPLLGYASWHAYRDLVSLPDSVLPVLANHI